MCVTNINEVARRKLKLSDVNGINVVRLFGRRRVAWLLTKYCSKRWLSPDFER